LCHGYCFTGVSLDDRGRLRLRNPKRYTFQWTAADPLRADRGVTRGRVEDEARFYRPDSYNNRRNPPIYGEAQIRDAWVISIWNCEGTMAHAITESELWPDVGFSPRPVRDKDALDAIRGVIAGTVLSVLGFWLPLAVYLTH
jgi:hypothetical protein